MQRSATSAAALALREHIKAEFLQRRTEELDAEQVYRSAVERRLAAERVYTASGLVLMKIEKADL